MLRIHFIKKINKLWVGLILLTLITISITLIIFFQDQNEKNLKKVISYSFQMPRKSVMDFRTIYLTLDKKESPSFLSEDAKSLLSDYFTEEALDDYAAKILFPYGSAAYDNSYTLSGSGLSTYQNTSSETGKQTADFTVKSTLTKEENTKTITLNLKAEFNEEGKISSIEIVEDQNLLDVLTKKEE